MAILPNFLEDAIDLHVHSAPDVDARRFDDLELAREAERVGMAAILIKSHQNSTVERAWLVSKVVTGIQVFRGAGSERDGGRVERCRGEACAGDGRKGDLDAHPVRAQSPFVSR